MLVLTSGWVMIGIGRMHNHHLDIGRRVSRKVADNVVIFIDAHLAFVQLFPQHNRFRPFEMGQQAPAIDICPVFSASQLSASARTGSCCPNSPADSAGGGRARGQGISGQRLQVHRRPDAVLAKELTPQRPGRIQIHRLAAGIEPGKF